LHKNGAKIAYKSVQDVPIIGSK